MILQLPILSLLVSLIYAISYSLSSFIFSVQAIDDGSSVFCQAQSLTLQNCYCSA